MAPTKLLWVVRKSAPPALAAALQEAGYDYEVVAATDALSHVANGSGRLVLCECVRGWPLLVGAVEKTGGAAVVWGIAQPGEPTPEVPRDVELVGTPAALLAALARAQARSLRRPKGEPASGASDARADVAERTARFAQLISEQTELHPLVSETTRAVESLLQADGAAVFFIDAESGEICFEATSAHVARALLPVRLRAGQGLVGRVALSAVPVLAGPGLPGVHFEQGPDTFLDFLPHSAIAVPLMRLGDVLGVLFAARAPGSEPFTAEHLRRLEELARHVAPAVHHVQTAMGLREAQTAILASNEDLERKVHERTQLLSRAKAEWEQTFDAIKEPIGIQDGFLVRRANTAYAARVGLPIREVLGRKCHELLAGRAQPCPGCPLLRGRGEELAGEVTLKHGATFRFSGFWSSPNLDDGRVVVHYRDVTHQKLLETQLRESERLASLGQLASGAAHEINNPIGFMTSNLNSLRDALSDGLEVVDTLAAGLGPSAEALRETLEDGIEVLEESLSGAKRVSAIVRGLRELSKLEVGATVPTDVNASVTRAVRAELGERPRNLRLHMEAERPALLQPLQLDQVLGHVLRNAQQASPHGGPITVRTSSTSEAVLIEVEDEGPGISAENLHRVFEPFFTTRGVGQGIGLGLTAAYGIVRRHGGTIEVQSLQGKGSKFTVRLLVAPGSLEKTPATRNAWPPAGVARVARGV